MTDFPDKNDRHSNCHTISTGFTTTTVNMQVLLKHKHAKLPFRKRDTDAGYDIYSVESKKLLPNTSTIIKTGIHIASPPGFYYTIEGRSSLWMKGIQPHRGIIDATYNGEVVVSLTNISNSVHFVDVGDRIAQIVLHRQYDANFQLVETFESCYNERGTEGFGSSGMK